MLLGRKHIIEEIEARRIICEPFDIKNVGPNSVDVHLSDTVKIVMPNDKIASIPVVNLKKPSDSFEIELKSGWILHPGRLAIGLTIESIGSDYYVPRMHGCSTLGRAGLIPHVEAGLGDVGFKSRWVLEIMTLAHPVILYPGMRIAQICFEEVSDNSYLYGRDCGHYANQDKPTEFVPGNV